VKATSSNSNSNIDLGYFAPLVRTLASLLADELRPMLAGQREDEVVDRKTAGVSKRFWDREKGRAFPIFRDGRRYVAKRADVMKALEKQARFEPMSQPAPEPKDPDERELVAAGIKLNGGAQ
jgi:hypothetical protein